MNEEHKSKVGAYWSGQYHRSNKALRTRWWQSPQIIRYVNKIICGEALEGWNAGPIRLLKQVLPENQIMETALSVGCGTGTKEMRFLEEKLVQNFICFDLSEESVKIGRKIAEEKGLSSRILFFCEDFFSSAYAEKLYDMVFWDNSLHHMPNASLAVQKSYEILKEGGIFFCNDFAGKTKFQWSDMELAIVNGIRLLLPDKIFHICDNGGEIPRGIFRVSVEQMNKIDPSEAADSSAIVPAIERTFKDPFIVQTGGLIYHLCLNDILINIEENSQLLDYMLSLDNETIKMGMQHYIFALGIK